jgi:hypothetical protein
LLHDAQGVVAEQNTRLAGPVFDVIQRYEEDLGEEAAGMLFCSLLEMLLDGGFLSWHMELSSSHIG